MSVEDFQYITSLINEGTRIKDNALKILSNSKRITRMRDLGSSFTGPEGHYLVFQDEKDIEQIVDLERDYRRWYLCLVNICKNYGVDSLHVGYNGIVTQFIKESPWLEWKEKDHAITQVQQNMDKLIDMLDTTLSIAKRGTTNNASGQGVTYNSYFFGDIIGSNVSIGELYGQISQTIDSPATEDKEEIRKLLEDVLNKIETIESTGEVDKSIWKKLSQYLSRNKEACTQIAMLIVDALMKAASRGQ